MIPSSLLFLLLELDDRLVFLLNSTGVNADLRLKLALGESDRGLSPRWGTERSNGGFRPDVPVGEDGRLPVLWRVGFSFSDVTESEKTRLGRSLFTAAADRTDCEEIFLSFFKVGFSCVCGAEFMGVSVLESESEAELRLLRKLPPLAIALALSLLVLPIGETSAERTEGRVALLGRWWRSGLLHL